MGAPSIFTHTATTRTHKNTVLGWELFINLCIPQTGTHEGESEVEQIERERERERERKERWGNTFFPANHNIPKFLYNLIQARTMCIDH